MIAGNRIALGAVLAVLFVVQPARSTPPGPSQPTARSAGTTSRDRLDLGEAWRRRQIVDAPHETAPGAPSGRQRAEDLLRRAGVTLSEQVPTDARLDLSAIPTVLPRDAVGAHRAWRLAWLTDDADAGFALLGPQTRAVIEQTLESWRSRYVGPDGWTKLLRHLRITGLARHADALTKLGRLEDYGLRKFFQTEWDHQHQQVAWVWEMLNSWEAQVGGSVVIFVAGRFTPEPHRIPLRATWDRESGVFGVEPFYHLLTP